MILSSDSKQSKKKTEVEQPEDYIGNNKKISIGINDRRLRIIGNGNRVYVGTNVGTMEIIGNSTRLSIANNSGSIMLTGNNGIIILGSDSTVKTAKFIGGNGTVTFASSEDLRTAKNKTQTKLMSSHSSPSSVPLQTNDLNCDDSFCKKFKKLTFNQNFGMDNVSMPTSLRGFQVNLGNINVGNIIKIGQSNIVINRS